MRSWDNSFDRDRALFEASRMLSLPTSVVQDLPQAKRVSTAEKGEVLKYFPLLYKELRIAEGEGKIFELWLLKEKAFEKDEPLNIVGEARVYIFSSTPSAPWRAGTCLQLLPGEKLSLERCHYRNHFIGVIRESEGLASTDFLRS